MNPESPSLPHQAIQQKGRLFAELVVVDEELLELVDDEQNARQLSVMFTVAGDILRADVAKAIAADAHFGIQSLHHAEAELPLALDGHDPRVRQLMRDVRLELDPFLEV